MGKKAFVCLALLMLLLPVLLAPLAMLTGLEADIPSYRSDARITAFSDDPIGYLTDRLALRTAAITGRARLLALIGESGSDQVIRGRDGFLFFAETLTGQGARPVSEEETDQITRQLLSLQSALAQEGRRLIVCIAPDKCSVYPDMLPDHVLPEEGSLAALNAVLEKAGLTVLDALTLLRQGRMEGQTYFRNDSHWNARGAYLMYQELMRLTGTADAPDYADVPLLPGTAGDLLLLCQPGTLPAEPDAAPDIPRTYRTARPMRTLDDATIRTTGGASELHLLVIRDSFGRGLFPYLANAAGSMTFSRSYKDIAAQARNAEADWVVLEIVERNVRELAALE